MPQELSLSPAPSIWEPSPEPSFFFTSGKIGGRPGFIKGLAPLSLVEFSPDLAPSKASGKTRRVQVPSIDRNPSTPPNMGPAAKRRHQIRPDGLPPMQACCQRHCHGHARRPVTPAPTWDADARPCRLQREAPKISKSNQQQSHPSSFVIFG